METRIFLASLAGAKNSAGIPFTSSRKFMIMRLTLRGLSLQTRFVALTGAGILALAAGLVVALGYLQASSLETKLHSFSENELGSMHALVLTAMERRLDDSQGVAVDVFEKW